MNILLVSYGDVAYDGRLRSLIAVFSKIGEVFSFTRDTKLSGKYGEFCNDCYLLFIMKVVAYAKKIRKIDLLMLDNRKATVPGFIIAKLCQPRLIIQDCRELYLFDETKSIKGKIGCVLEKMMARRANIVICANVERAEIMKKEYGLSEQPLVYQNVRSLEYGTREEVEKAKSKFSEFIHNDEVRIISSSGCSIQRTNDILVKNFDKVKLKSRLFLVGESSLGERNKLLKLSLKNKKNSLTILDQLTQTELKYLISQCQIGIVNYGQYDANNKFCASGKLFEFIYEGIPVVTTTNPPLKRICEREKIGESDNNYSVAINKVLNNYSQYKENVENFSKFHTVEANDRSLLEALLKKICVSS